MKIIFLDIDGVLNSRTFIQATQWDRGDEGLPLTDDRVSWERQLDPAAVARLIRIVERTDAKIVVSSSWRHALPVSQIDRILRRMGLPHCIVGRTDDMPHGCRGDEIAAWMATAQRPCSFVILDDDADMAPVADRLVQTTFDLGLQDEHVERAVAMLGAKS